MKKQSKADFLRSWGITDAHYLRTGFDHLRYKSPPEKGVYWHYFSLFVRQRDVAQYGTCISCDRPITVDTSDAGHFIPASKCGRDLLFDPLNVNAECNQCNAWDESHLFGYERGLAKRYGMQIVETLKSRFYAYRDSKTPIKDYRREEYEAFIKQCPSYAHNVVLAK